MSSTGNQEADFVINQLVFFLALAISLATTAGIGIKIATYIKKKASESSQKVQKAIEDRINEQDITIKRYIENIVDSARERRDKQDYVIEQLAKRMDGLEEQQKIQMQVVLQNQQTITDFISSQKTGRGVGRPKKEESST